MHFWALEPLHGRFVFLLTQAILRQADSLTPQLLLDKLWSAMEGELKHNSSNHRFVRHGAGSIKKHAKSFYGWFLFCLNRWY